MHNRSRHANSPNVAQSQLSGGAIEASVDDAVSPPVRRSPQSPWFSTSSYPENWRQITDFERRCLSLTRPHQKSIHPQLIESTPPLPKINIDEFWKTRQVLRALVNSCANEMKTQRDACFGNDSILFDSSAAIFRMPLNASNRIQGSCGERKDQFVWPFVMSHEG